MVVPPDRSILLARSLRHTYRGTPALTGVSLDMQEGEVLAVVGPRGAGKTTLLKCLSGQLRPEHGEIWFDGEPVHCLPAPARDRLRRNRFGWIGSTPELVPELTAAENAALPLLLCGVPHRIALNTAHEWLDRLDVGACARRRPADLLQAQRQRVAAARALTALPEVLFADEPTAPLHLADRRRVLRALTAAVRSHRISMLLATHDADVAAFADRRIDLVDGSIAEHATGLRRPPGRGRQCVPEAAADLPGDAPDAHPGTGAQACVHPGTQACVQAEVHPGAPAEAEPDPGTRPAADPGAKGETGTESETDAGTESETDAGTESETDADAGTPAPAAPARPGRAEPSPSRPEPGAAAPVEGGPPCSRH